MRDGHREQSARAAGGDGRAPPQPPRAPQQQGGRPAGGAPNPPRAPQQQQGGRPAGGASHPPHAPAVVNATLPFAREAAHVAAPPALPAALPAAGNVSGTSGIDERFLSPLKFTDPAFASRLSAPTRRALAEVFKFERMSKVQAATLPLLLDGKDVFAKAKTGAGKTLSFLIPAVETLLRNPAPANGHRIGIFVVSPTRELAQQILAEAQTLLRFHGSWTAQVVIGGTNINSEKNRMQGRGGISVDILVATPGRAVDHIENTPGFTAAMGAARVLILDEADRLLDMGFKAALDKILSVLPPGGGRGGAGHTRQTMLFSATVPEEVKSVALRCLRAGYDLVDTVGAEEPQTNAQVHQELLVTPPSSVIPALARALANIVRSDPAHKVIVFFTTARLTGYMAGVFEKMPVPKGPIAGGATRFNIVEMHSRKSQGYRTGAAERFRSGFGILMFSSDVSARGMDYPGITHVVQVGLTDRESYIHRVGRTARAGKSGSGLLLLADYEAPALMRDLRDIPIKIAGPTSALTGGVANGVPGPTTPGAAVTVTAPPELAALLASVPSDKELKKESLQCYSATLGFYNGHIRKLGWDKPRLVAEVNTLMLGMGLTEVPLMSRETLGKMGLRGTPGLREAPKGWRPDE